ncbi:hypothetical protein [Acinetobacter sp.]|uniref:hypothetical protein n=1 Tax=Acinetobacter sp. TaxID=472 RepID=UPI003D0929BF
MATPTLSAVSIRRAFESIWTFYFRSKTFLTGVSISRGVKHRLLRIVDKNYQPLTGASVQITDGDGLLILDELTESDGVINSFLDEAVSNPITLTISKAGYRSIALETTIEKKEDWLFVLEDADQVESMEKIPFLAGVNIKGDSDIKGKLTVTNDIETAGKVDGVDVSLFKSEFDTHDHGDQYINEEIRDVHTPTSGQTLFTLSNTPRPGSVKMYVNTAKQVYLTDFTISGNQVTWISSEFTFDGADLVEFYYYI